MFWDLLEFFRKSFAENILSQHEGTRSHESGVACLVAFCLGSTLVSRETCWWLVGGPPPHGGGQVRGRPSRGPLVPHLSYLITLHVGHVARVLWYFLHHPTPCLGL